MVTGGFVSSIDVVIFLVHRYPTFLVLDFLYIFFFVCFSYMGWFMTVYGHAYRAGNSFIRV